jgi:maltose phosphorylase
MSIIEGFAGVRILDNKIHLNTKIPKNWESYSLNLILKTENLMF